MPSDDPSGNTQWTVLKTLQWTVDYFKRNNLENARIDAEVLLSHALQCQRIDLYLRFDQPLNPDELARYKQLIQRRIRREPVAYITGTKEFWSLRFEVTPAVLIPRPDTEILVAAALQKLPAGNGLCRILELGVGSGAVITALAHERPNCRFWGSDRSWPAVEVARSNARMHGVDHLIRFWTGSWLDAIAPQNAFFTMILSNPPYIPSRAIERLDPDVRDFEPVAALDGGPDGLQAVGRLIDQAHGRLLPDGFLLLEIGFDQRAGVAALAQACGAYDPPEFHQDYGGHDRAVVLHKRSQTKAVADR